MGNGIALRESDGEKGTALLPLEKTASEGKKRSERCRESTSSPTVGLSHSADGKPKQQEGDGALDVGPVQQINAAPPKCCGAVESLLIFGIFVLKPQVLES